MSETPNLELRITDNSEQTVKALDGLVSAIRKIKTAVGKGIGLDGAATKIEQFGIKVGNAITDDVVSRYERFAEAVSKIKGIKLPTISNPLAGTDLETALNKRVQFALGNGAERASLIKQFTREVDAGLAKGTLDDSQVQIYQNAIDGLVQTERALDSVQIDANRKTQDAAPAAREAAESTKTFRDRLKELFTTMSAGKHHSNGLLSAFIRIAKYRFLRTVIKEITDGFKMGLSNMYEYAKVIGHTFAPAVDSAQNALFKMKNSLGAALAPVLQMIIPYVVQLVKWFINLINVVNQFFALLRGQTTWTRATDAAASSMDKVRAATSGVGNAAREAQKEVKGLLADWDELNIIQQDTGDNVGSGSGSGGGASGYLPIDYASMFEEVDVFDEKIKKIVDRIKNIINWVKDNFEKIKEIVKLIGAAIFAWKVSNFFGGIIGTLLRWGTVGLTAAIVFEITTLLDEQYLQTGEPGWLVANVLTAALGAGIASQCASTVASHGTGIAVGSIVLAISALADVIAILNDTDVSALDEKSLILALTSAAKLGAGIAWLEHSALKKDWTTTAKAGVGSALVWLGVSVGAKALKDVIDTGEITKEDIIANVGAAVSSAAGLTMLMNANFKKDWMKSAEIGAGAGLIMLGAPIAVKAIKGVMETEEITDESIKDGLLGFLPIAAGISSITAGFTPRWRHAKKGGSAGIGFGSTFLLLGASIGVKALKGVVDAGEITEQSVKDAVTSGVASSLGVGLLAAGLGASATTAAFAAAGALLVTGLAFGATVGIVALLQMEPENIHWGKEKLTEEQVQSFVSEKMFNVDVNATLNLVDMSVKVTASERAKVIMSARRLFSKLKVLQISVDNINSLKDAKDQVDTLISDIKAYAKTQTTMLETGISLVPIITETGEDMSAEVLKSGITGWNTVTGYMDNLGKQLSDALIDSATGEIKKNWDTEMVEDILKKVQNINAAVLGAKNTSAAKSRLQEGLGDLTSLDKSSFNKVLSLYDDYSKELEKSFRGIREEEISSFEQLEAYYRAMAENEAGTALGEQYLAEAEKYSGIAKTLRELLDSNVKSALDKELEPGKQMIIDWMEKVASDAFENAKIGNSYFGGFQGIRKEDTESAKKEIENLVAFATNIPEEAVKVLGAASAWEKIGEEAKKRIIETLRNNVGPKTVEGVFELAGIDVSKYLNIDGITESAESATEEVQDLNEQLTEFQDKVRSSVGPQRNRTVSGEGIILDAAEQAEANATFEYDKPEPVIIDLPAKYNIVQDKNTNPFETQINFLEGNVDLYNRKLIDAKKLIEAGWEDVGDVDYATIFQQTYSAGDIAKGYDWEFGQNIGIIATPILPDGTVLTPDELESYLEDSISKSSNANELIQNDDLGVLINVAEIDGELKDAYEIMDEWSEKLHEKQAELYDTQYDTGDIEALTEKIREALNNSNLETSDPGALAAFWNNTIQDSIDEIGKAGGLDNGAIEALSDTLYDDWLSALANDDWDGSVQGIMDKIKQAISEPSEWNIPSVDDSGIVNGLSGTATNIESFVGRIRGAIKSLDGLSFNFSGGLMGGGFKVVMPAMAAEGGMFTTGQMFIARERGPEIVGTMNGKSTVANNNQIVSGISAGVATANQEEVRTLNRIEALLNRIEKKEFAAKVVPSSGFGKDVRRSLDMYARNTGVSG